MLCSHSPASGFNRLIGVNEESMIREEIIRCRSANVNQGKVSMVSALLVLCHVADPFFTIHESRWSLIIFPLDSQHSTDAALLP